MKKSMLEIYALAVCFVTVTCLVVCVGISGYSVVTIASPEFTMRSYEYEGFQSNEAYWKGQRGRICSKEDKEAVRPSEDELTKARTEAFEQALVRERRDGAQTLVKTLIVMVVDALAFSVHWIIARRARVSAGPNNTLDPA